MRQRRLLLMTTCPLRHNTGECIREGLCDIDMTVGADVLCALSTFTHYAPRCPSVIIDLLFSALVQLHSLAENLQSTQTVKDKYARQSGSDCLRHPTTHGYAQAARAHWAFIAGVFIGHIYPYASSYRRPAAMNNRRHSYYKTPDGILNWHCRSFFKRRRVHRRLYTTLAPPLTL